VQSQAMLRHQVQLHYRLLIVFCRFRTERHCECPNERDGPEQSTGRNSDPTHGFDSGSLWMTPFARELTWQFAQADDHDNSNKNKNGKHKKSECV
jgi:hypothetical protein